MSGYNKQQIRLKLNSDIKPSFKAVQFDNGRELHFIFDDFLLDSNIINEARIYILKPSGHEIYNECKIVNTEVVVMSTTQMLAEVGKNIGAIQLIYAEDETKKVTSFPFIMNVCKNVVDTDSIESKDEFTILDTLIAEARKLIKEVETAEKEREVAENERQENENTRQIAEENRENAENVRNTNETNREKAETKRQEDTANAIKNCETATGNANTATIAANQATENANSKAQLADTAAINANNKATLANTAANNANEKAKLANDAAVAAKNAESNALKATEDANTAATNADSKAAIANNAAENADSKAELANTAASKANDAADRANKVADELDGLSGTLINDNKVSTSTTYSSQKITNLLENVFQVSPTEPTNQMPNGVWFIEEP